MLSGIIVLYIILVFFNPYTTGSMTLPVLAMMVLAFIGVIATLKSKPYAMLIISLALFVPMGFYMLGAPSVFRWIGIFNLLFLVTSLLMVKEKITIT